MSVDVARRLAQIPQEGQFVVPWGQSYPEFVSNLVLLEIADQFKGDKTYYSGNTKQLILRSRYSSQCSRWEDRKSYRQQGIHQENSSWLTMRNLECKNSRTDNKC